MKSVKWDSKHTKPIIRVLDRQLQKLYKILTFIMPSFVYKSLKFIAVYSDVRCAHPKPYDI